MITTDKRWQWQHSAVYINIASHQWLCCLTGFTQSAWNNTFPSYFLIWMVRHLLICTHLWLTDRYCGQIIVPSFRNYWIWHFTPFSTALLSVCLTVPLPSVTVLLCLFLSGHWLLFVLALCARLSWSHSAFWVHVKFSYHIIYTVGHKKTCHFIWDHNSRVLWWIFTLLAPMQNRKNYSIGELQNLQLYHNCVSTLSETI